MNEIKFESAFMYYYNPREGTPAAKMTEQVEKSIKEQRAAMMTAATEEIRRRFLEGQIGKTLEVLTEEHHSGYIQGYTANYTPVKIASSEKLCGIIKAKITAVDDDFCIGEI